jgi:NAD+ synthase (glutamine-hydrolysing)
MKAMGRREFIQDITFENIQARTRTAILMNTANQKGGLVIGTGDLSELALGWCTYNADQMSMYAVNTSIPKTLVKVMIKWYASVNPGLEKVLSDILATPVSPELVGTGAMGEQAQVTEDKIGPYELHDFFLYNTLRHGFGPEKILYLAMNSELKDYGLDVIKKWLILFYTRFFSQQFKRSCMPDGPKVGSISLSPRGDWRMPSDASSKLWIELVNKYNGDNN